MPVAANLFRFAFRGLVGSVMLLAAAGCHKAGVADGVTIRIGDQGKALELPLELSGQDKGASYSLDWMNFADGPHMNAAFIADDIDIGAMGDTPVLLAQAARADVVVIAARRVEPNTYTQIVARAGSGIHTLADLRGRRVAITKGTANQGYLALALDSVHLRLGDVQVVDLPIVSLGGALQSGSADAAVLGGPPLANYLVNHPGALLVNAPNAGYGVILAARKALANPAKAAAIRDFLARLVKAGRWIVTHGSTWQEAYYAKYLHQPPAVAELTARRGEALPLYQPVGDDLPRALRDQARLLVDTGLLPRGVDLVGPLFDPATTLSFNKVVAKASS